MIADDKITCTECASTYALLATYTFSASSYTNDFTGTQTSLAYSCITNASGDYTDALTAKTCTNCGWASPATGNVAVK